MKILTLQAVLAMAVSACAQKFGTNDLAVDFTQPVAAMTNVTWSGRFNCTLTTNGLAWDGLSDGVGELWIQSKPMGIGRFWRAALGADVEIFIDPPLRPATAQHVKSADPYGEMVFVRYGPDKKHWSSWQALQRTDTNDAGRLLRAFRGRIGVPELQRQKYDKLVEEFGLNIVPQLHNEERAVKWVLQREPHFFEVELPFLGYVEFRYEARLPKDQWISAIKMKVSWSAIGSAFTDITGGVSWPDIPWRFEAN